jgi:hypothetical protein
LKKGKKEGGKRGEGIKKGKEWKRVKKSEKEGNRGKQRETDGGKRGKSEKREKEGKLYSTVS